MPGGLNTYGVAEYKLPARASLEEIELIRGLGVEFRYETEIRTQQDLEQLERNSIASFSALGWARRIASAFPETITAM